MPEPEGDIADIDDELLEEESDSCDDVLRLLRLIECDDKSPCGEEQDSGDEDEDDDDDGGEVVNMSFGRVELRMLIGSSN